MAWSLSQTVYAIQDDPANNRRLYRTDVYLNWNQYQTYAGGNSANGGGSVDGQGFSWSGPTSGGSTSAGSQVINTSDFWVYGDANGWHGTVNASAWFNGGGGYAPGYITASASTGGFDYWRGPGSPSSCTATLNADKSITVSAGAASSPAGAATYYVQYAISTDSGASWAAWTNQQTMSGQSFTYAGLTPGRHYKFRVWATNSDGTGGFTESAAVFLPSGFRVKNSAGVIVYATSVGVKTANGRIEARAVRVKTANGIVDAK